MKNTKPTTKMTTTTTTTPKINLAHPNPPTTLNPWPYGLWPSGFKPASRTNPPWNYYLPLGPIPEEVLRPPPYNSFNTTIERQNRIEGTRLPTCDLRFLASLGRGPVDERGRKKRGVEMNVDVGPWDGNSMHEGEVWGFCVYRGGLGGGEGLGGEDVEWVVVERGGGDGDDGGGGKEEDEEKEGERKAEKIRSVRFRAGVERLTLWTQFYVRQSRYEGEDALTWEKWPEFMPLPPTPGQDNEFKGVDSTDVLALRFWCQVVEDYRGGKAEEVPYVPLEWFGTWEGRYREMRGVNGQSGIAGEEVEKVTNNRELPDFSPIGRAFGEYVRDLADVKTRGSNAVDLYYRIARYDHCIILDEETLEALEKLPFWPPDVEAPEEKREMEELDAKGWVWLLHRETMERWDDDEKEGRPHQGPPPWIRIRLSRLAWLWFRHSQWQSPVDWEECCGEDEERPGSVYWWNDEAVRVNEERRRRRDIADRDDSEGEKGNDAENQRKGCTAG